MRGVSWFKKLSTGQHLFSLTRGWLADKERAHAAYWLTKHGVNGR